MGIRKTPRTIHPFRILGGSRCVFCELKTEEFLNSRVETIKADGVQGDALTWLNRVLGADGITPSEQRFLSTLEARFYPA